MQFSPTPFNDHSRFKREDWWNVAQFLVITLLLGYWFDSFILEPKRAELRSQEIARQEAIKANPDPVQPARPRDAVLAEAQRVELSNGDVRATIALKRGNLDDLSLKQYFTTIAKTDPINLLSPSGTDYPLYTETGWLSDLKTDAMPDKNTVWQVVDRQDERQVTISWTNATGLTFLRTFTLDDQYMVTVRDVIRNTRKEEAKVWPYALISQHGLPQERSRGIVHEGAIGYIGENFVEYNYSEWSKLKGGAMMFEGPTGWLGITNHYFFVGLIPDQKENMVYRAAYQPPLDSANTHDKARYQVDIQGVDRTVAAGAETEFVTRIFVGPKKLRMLEAYEKQMGLVHFDLAVDFGWFYFLTKPFYYVLVYINDFVGNFGVAIILLTLLIKLCVFPLANTSYRSFAKLKIVAPQIQQIQQTYANDKKRMQEELVKMYQKERVNPLSGCLPILAQIPIFFAVYKVISVAIEMRHAPFFGWIQDLSAPDPTSIFNLYGALPYDVHSWLHFGAWPTVLFLLIMVQIRLSPPPADRMMYIFFNYYYPVFIAFIMAKFEAGLVIYWAFSALFSITQQIVIMRSLGADIHLFNLMPWSKKKEGATAAPTLDPFGLMSAPSSPPAVAGPAESLAEETSPQLPDHVKPKNKKK